MNTTTTRTLGQAPTLAALVAAAVLSASVAHAATPFRVPNIEIKPGLDNIRGPITAGRFAPDTGKAASGPVRFSGALEGGKVFGRGSNDAKASIAAMMCVAAGVDRARLAGRLVFAFVCDEETGGQGLEAVAPTLPPISAAVA